MSNSESTPKPDRAALHQACIDALLTELRIARDRIADLENDCTTFRMLSAAALESVVRLTARNKELGRQRGVHQAQIEVLLGTPCLVCQRRRRDTTGSGETAEATIQ